MDKTVRKFASFEEVKDEEYRYWQSVTPEERIRAAWELCIDSYRTKGIEPNGQGLRRTLVRFERT
jgi:IS1 family transposase